jgi:ElaB/YqjD/DUF883 family membrane-anchored ribosome-binding protein
MELTDLRSKEEVTRDMDRERSRARMLVKDTKYMFVERNPGVRAWRATRAALNTCKTKVTAGSRAVVTRIRSTNDYIQIRTYRSIAVTLVAGMVLGWLTTSRRRARFRVR